MRQFMIVKGYENKGVVLPKRSTAFSAGYDFRCLDGFTLAPHASMLVPTGVKAAMEKDDVLLLYPRSSLAIKKGLQLTNSVAVIDADYFGNPQNDGHIMVPVYNFSDHAVTIEAGERIAQGIFTKYLKTDDDVADGLRSGGYGSTGTK
jgi:dUTP pyrophosphatase